MKETKPIRLYIPDLGKFTTLGKFREANPTLPMADVLKIKHCLPTAKVFATLETGKKLEIVRL